MLKRDKCLLWFVVGTIALTWTGCNTPTAPSVVGEVGSYEALLVSETFEEPIVIEAESGPEFTNSIRLGLDADMSAGAATGGQSIRRGVELAIEEINQAGGVLGRPLELVVRDHRGNPDRGVDNIRELAKLDQLIAIFGGIHTAVAIHELPAIHESEVIYLSPWAAGTPIVDNGYEPNFVFRVSVRDEYAGGFLVEQALRRNHRRIGLLLERTAWGRSSESAMTRALAEAGNRPVAVEWFNWGEPSLASQIETLAAEADVILAVCNPLEGITLARDMSRLPTEERRPIISHWGITGGDFYEATQDVLPGLDLVFLQTFSFLQTSHRPKTKSLVDAYLSRYEECSTIREIPAPVGTAHAYELVHLLRAAIEKAGSTNRAAVRDSLEQLRDFAGLIRDYEAPFSPEHHDALTVADYHLAKFDHDGAIVPVTEDGDR